MKFMANPESDNYIKDRLNFNPLNSLERSVWLEAKAKELASKFKDKYIKGQVEHQGDIGAVPVLALLDEMEHEALDQLSYVAELRRRILLTSGR